jgi:hypothetical protein
MWALVESAIAMDCSNLHVYRLGNKHPGWDSSVTNYRRSHKIRKKEIPVCAQIAALLTISLNTAGRRWVDLQLRHDGMVEKKKSRLTKSEKWGDVDPRGWRRSNNRR